MHMHLKALNSTKCQESWSGLSQVEVIVHAKPQQELNFKKLFYDCLKPEYYGHTANTHVLEVQGLGTLRGSQEQALQGLAIVDH